MVLRMSASASPMVSSHNSDQLQKLGSALGRYKVGEEECTLQSGKDTMPICRQPFDSLATWHTVEFDRPGTLQYRTVPIVDYKQGRAGNSRHDLPLHVTGSELLNFVCLTPGQGECETAENDPFHPIKLNQCDLLPSHCTDDSWSTTWSFGFLPQTWIKADVFQEFRPGSGWVRNQGEPLEVVAFGSQLSAMGEGFPVRLVGAFALLGNRGELYWKLLAVAAQDEQLAYVRTLRELQESSLYNAEGVRGWLSTRHSDNVAEGQAKYDFANGGSPLGEDWARCVVKDAHATWQLMAKEGTPRIRWSLPAGSHPTGPADYELLWSPVSGPMDSPVAIPLRLQTSPGTTSEVHLAAGKGTPADSDSSLCAESETEKSLGTEDFSKDALAIWQAEKEKMQPIRQRDFEAEISEALLATGNVTPKAARLATGQTEKLGRKDEEKLSKEPGTAGKESSSKVSMFLKSIANTFQSSRWNHTKLKSSTKDVNRSHLTSQVGLALGTSGSGSDESESARDPEAYERSVGGGLQRTSSLPGMDHLSQAEKLESTLVTRARRRSLEVPAPGLTVGSARSESPTSISGSPRQRNRERDSKEPCEPSQEQCPLFPRSGPLPERPRPDSWRGAAGTTELVSRPARRLQVTRIPAKDSLPLPPGLVQAVLSRPGSSTLGGSLRTTSSDPQSPQRFRPQASAPELISRKAFADVAGPSSASQLRLGPNLDSAPLPGLPLPASKALQPSGAPWTRTGGKPALLGEYPGLRQTKSAGELLPGRRETVSAGAGSSGQGRPPRLVDTRGAVRAAGTDKPAGKPVVGASAGSKGQLSLPLAPEERAKKLMSARGESSRSIEDISSHGLHDSSRGRSTASQDLPGSDEPWGLQQQPMPETHLEVCEDGPPLDEGLDLPSRSSGPHDAKDQGERGLPIPGAPTRRVPFPAVSIKVPPSPNSSPEASLIDDNAYVHGPVDEDLYPILTPTGPRGRQSNRSSEEEDSPSSGRSLRRVTFLLDAPPRRQPLLSPPTKSALKPSGSPSSASQGTGAKLLGVPAGSPSVTAGRGDRCQAGPPVLQEPPAMRRIGGMAVPRAYKQEMTQVASVTRRANEPNLPLPVSLVTQKGSRSFSPPADTGSLSPVSPLDFLREAAQQQRKPRPLARSSAGRPAALTALA